MNIKFALFAILTFAFSSSSWAVEISSSTLHHEPCKLHDKNFGNCLVELIQDAIELLKIGSSKNEFGLKSLDPLFIPKLTIDSGKGVIQLIQYYTNVTTTGFGNAKVIGTNFNEKDKILLILLNLPKLIQKGHYKVDGKILSLPIIGDGDSELIFENCDIELIYHLKEIQKNGKEYLQIKSQQTDITPRKVKVHYENLFNGKNKLLADNMNQIMNEEWKTLYNDVKPSVSKKYGKILRTYSNTFMDNFSLDQFVSI